MKQRKLTLRAIKNSKIRLHQDYFTFLGTKNIFSNFICNLCLIQQVASRLDL